MTVEYLKTDYIPIHWNQEQKEESYTLGPDFNEFSLLGYVPKQEDTLDFLKELLNNKAWANSTYKDFQESNNSVDDLGDYGESLSPDQPKSNSGNTSAKFDIPAAMNLLNNIVYYDLNYPNLNVKKDPRVSSHRCAMAIRMVMEAGKLNTKNRPKYGGEYGPFLEKNGWKKISGNSVFQPGDICVTKGLGKKGYGHIAMFNGQDWVSDFVQNGPLVYKNAKVGVNTFFYRYIG